MHYVRVTLVTGQQLTITVEVPPGTPVDQLQIPGLPAAIASIVDLGSTETTPTPTATTAPTITATPSPTASATRTPENQAGGKTKTKDKSKSKDKGKTKPDPRPRRRAAGRGADQRVRTPTRESLTGKVEKADADAHARAPTTTAADQQADAPEANDPSYTLAEPGAAKIGVPNFFIDKFRIPPFLLPIYQAAGTQYGIRWELLAAINEIETNYGRNLNVSSAGAQGWMQFMPAVVEGLRRRRQQRRPDGPVQPGRRDLRRRALPEGRGRRHGHPQGGLRLQPRRLVRGLACCCAPRSSAACRPTSSARSPASPRAASRSRPRPRYADQVSRRSPEDDEPQPLGPARRRQPPRPRDLRRRRLARGRGQRRPGDQDRRLGAARQLRPGPGRLRQHVHVRQAGQDLPALRRAQAAEGGPGRGQADAGPAARRQGAQGRGLGHRPARLARAEQAARRGEHQGAEPATEVSRAPSSRRSRSACSPTRRAPTPPPPAAPSRSSCARAASTAR